MECRDCRMVRHFSNIHDLPNDSNACTNQPPQLSAEHRCDRATLQRYERLTSQRKILPSEGLGCSLFTQQREAAVPSRLWERLFLA